MRKLLLPIISVFAAIGSVRAQELDMYARIPADEAVVVGRLDNGMTYYLRHNAKPEGQADFYIYHDVGAVQEEDSQNGLAHYLEHMAFNGTVNLPGKTLIDYLETIGVKFGANLNAGTGHELTYYMMHDVPLSREGVTDTALLILHDWSRFIALEDDEIDKERGVVLEELRGGRNAGRRLMEESWRLLYNDSRYAHRNIIGTEDIIKNFSPATLRDFYQRWYRPDLQAIVIVGDIDVREVERKLIEVMKDIPAVVDPEPKQMPVIADNDAPLIGVFTDPELTSSQISLYIKRASLPDEVNDLVIANKIAILNTLIAQMTNYRLQEISQKPDAPFLYAVMQNGRVVKALDAATFIALARPGEVGGAFEALYGEVEKIRRWGFNEGELERAKTELLRSQEMAYDSRDDRKNGDFVNSYLANFSSNSAMPSAEMSYEINTLLINSTVLAEINGYAPQILPRANEVVIAMAPQKEDLPTPTTEELAAVITKVQGAELTAYEDNTVREPLIDRELDTFERHKIHRQADRFQSRRSLPERILRGRHVGSVGRGLLFGPDPGHTHRLLRHRPVLGDRVEQAVGGQDGGHPARHQQLFERNIERRLVERSGDDPSADVSQFHLAAFRHRRFRLDDGQVALSIRQCRAEPGGDLRRRRSEHDLSRSDAPHSVAQEAR